MSAFYKLFNNSICTADSTSKLLGLDQQTRVAAFFRNWTQNILCKEIKMRSILFSAALVITAVTSSGCATLNVGSCGGCGVDSACDNQSCSTGRVGGLLGRLRGEAACSDCQTGSCPTGTCNSQGGGNVGGGMVGGGIAGGRLAGKMSGLMGGGFGNRMGGGACNSCGMAAGACACGNHAPYTPGFAGPHGPSTGTYGYPYYTTRAPRDFLMANPPSIGR